MLKWVQWRQGTLAVSSNTPPFHGFSLPFGRWKKKNLSIFFRQLQTHRRETEHFVASYTQSYSLDWFCFSGTHFFSDCFISFCATILPKAATKHFPAVTFFRERHLRAERWLEVPPVCVWLFHWQNFLAHVMVQLVEEGCALTQRELLLSGVSNLI